MWPFSRRNPPPVARYEVHCLADGPALARMVDRYLDWCDRFRPDGVFELGPATEGVAWNDPSNRPHLWTLALSPNDPLDTYGWHLCALDAIPAAFEVDDHRARHAGWGVGCIWYVRAAHRGKGIGRGLWQATCSWLAFNAPRVHYIVWEPPVSGQRAFLGTLGGFVACPRHSLDTPQCFFPTSAHASLGDFADLVVDPAHTPHAQLDALGHGEVNDGAVSAAERVERLRDEGEAGGDGEAVARGDDAACENRIDDVDDGAGDGVLAQHELDAGHGAAGAGEIRSDAESSMTTGGVDV